MRDTKADPDSSRCTVEVCQPDNAPDPFRGCMGLPQPVFPKGLCHTQDWAGTSPGTIEGADKRGIAQVFIGRPICWNQPAPTWGPEGVPPRSPCPRQSNYMVGTGTGGVKEKEAPAHREKLSQSAVGPVVLNPPGTFPKLEASSPTRPDLNPQVNQRLQHLRRSWSPLWRRSAWIYQNLKIWKAWAQLPEADMMILPRTTDHAEISPDTFLMPTTDRAPKVLVVPTGDPEGMTGGPARALTLNLQSTILKKALALNWWPVRSMRNGARR